MAPRDTADEPQPEPQQQTHYEIIGGAEVVRSLVDRFYDVMDTDPAAAGIRAMHAKDLTPMRERLGDFLIGWLGGPQLYFQRPDAKCMGMAHRPFPIGEPERDQWMVCMRVALAECIADEALRGLFDKALAHMADAFRSRRRIGGNLD